MRGRKISVPRLQGLALWVPVTALLTLGLLTTVIDLFSLPVKQATFANEHRQRFVVNPVSGEVSLGTGDQDEPVAGEPKQPEFDVGTEPEKPPEGTPETSPDATPPEGGPKPETGGETATTTEPEPPAPEESPLPQNAPALRTEPYTADLNAPVHTKESLVPAPAPEVTELVDGLRIPKRGDKDVNPSQLYARPFKRKDEQILISFVVLDAGLDPQSIGLMMGLPPEVSVAYSPYTKTANSYSENLRAAGHEVWAMLPTMGERYPSDDPGPLGIIARMPLEETLRRLHEVMAATPGIVGIVLPPDETISLQKGALVPVMSEVDRRGLFALATHPSHSIEQITSDKKFASTSVRRADLVLDPTPNEAQIRSKLAGLFDSAKEKGEYLVVLSARPQSLQILLNWLHDNPLPEPMVLAPLSGMYQPKTRPEPVEAEKPAGGHGEEKKEEKKEEKPKPKDKKKEKVLPQDQYKQKPEGEKKEGGH